MGWCVFSMPVVPVVLFKSGLLGGGSARKRYRLLCGLDVSQSSGHLGVARFVSLNVHRYAWNKHADTPAASCAEECVDKLRLPVQLWGLLHQARACGQSWLRVVWAAATPCLSEPGSSSTLHGLLGCVMLCRVWEWCWF